jgi:hypothetical protein
MGAGQGYDRGSIETMTMNNTDELSQDKKPIFVDECIRQEILEIAGYLMEIRNRTGWGTVTVTMRDGDVHEIDLHVKIRPKVEKKKT